MSTTSDPPATEPNERDGLAGCPRTPPPLGGPVTFDQQWHDLTFIHWPVHPESVEPMYPLGTYPDVFADGMTYVGLIPFAMSSTKVGSALHIPYFGSFLETNVRLYSVDAAGHQGVLFRSLETARLAVVPVTRAASVSLTPGPRCGCDATAATSRMTACAVGPGAACAAGSRSSLARQ